MRYARYLLLSTRQALAMALVRWFYESATFLRVFLTLSVGLAGVFLGIHGFYKAQAAVKAGLSSLVEAHPAGWVLAAVLCLLVLAVLVRAIWAMSCAVGNATERVSPQETMHLKNLLARHRMRPLDVPSRFHAWESALIKTALSQEATGRALGARLEAKLPTVDVATPRARL